MKRRLLRRNFLAQQPASVEACPPSRASSRRILRCNGRNCKRRSNATSYQSVSQFALL